MIDITYKYKQVRLENIRASETLKSAGLFERFAAIPFRATNLADIPHENLLNFLRWHPLVVESQGKKNFCVTGNLHSMILLQHLPPGTKIPLLVEYPPIPREIFLREAIERELLNILLLAVQNGCLARALSSLYGTPGANMHESEFLSTKLRFASLAGVNRREL